MLLIPPLQFRLIKQSMQNQVTVPIDDAPSTTAFIEEKSVERHFGLMKSMALLNLAKLAVFIAVRVLFGSLKNNNSEPLFENMPFLNELLWLLYVLIVFAVSFGERQTFPLLVQHFVCLVTTGLEVLIVLSVRLDIIFEATALFLGCFHVYMLLKLNRKVYPDPIKTGVFTLLSFLTIFVLVYIVFREDVLAIELCEIKVNLALGSLLYCFWFSLMCADHNYTIRMTMWFSSFSVLAVAFETARDTLHDLAFQLGIAKADSSKSDLRIQ